MMPKEPYLFRVHILDSKIELSSAIERIKALPSIAEATESSFKGRPAVLVTATQAATKKGAKREVYFEFNRGVVMYDFLV